MSDTHSSFTCKNIESSCAITIDVTDHEIQLACN